MAKGSRRKHEKDAVPVRSVEPSPATVRVRDIVHKVTVASATPGAKDAAKAEYRVDLSRLGVEKLLGREPLHTRKITVRGSNVRGENANRALRRALGPHHVVIGPKPASTACPTCSGLMAPASGLSREHVSAGERVVVVNLNGARCDKCGHVELDAASAAQYAAAVAPRLKADYSMRIARLSGKRLGIYLPDDVLRVMDLHGGEHVYCTPLTRRRAVLDIEPAKTAATSDDAT